MKISMRVVGLDDIGRKAEAMGAALRRETLVPIIEESLEPMASDMRAGAPRRSGALAESMTIGTELSPAQAASNVPIAEIEVYAGPGPLPQAVQIEFGNSHQQPEPFIRPAFDGNVQSALRRVGEQGIDAILAAGKRG